jgi:hypothetical protein
VFSNSAAQFSSDSVAKMDEDGFDEFDEDARPLQRMRVVPRMKIRELAYSCRTAGLCCGEIQMMEEIENYLLELGFAICECFEADFLDEEEKRNVMLTWFMQCLVAIEKRMPMIINCDLPSGRELAIDRLCDSWCWNSFRFRKEGLREIFDGSR